MKKRVALLVGMFAVAFAGVAQAETRLAVQDATGAVDKFVVTDTGSIGINVANPIYKFHMVGAGDPSTTALFVANTGRAVGYLPSDSGGFNFFRNNDVSVNSGLPRAYDRLGYFAFGSNINGNKTLAMLQAFAEANATAASAPSFISFSTTSAGTTSAVEKIRINSTGNLGIGTGNPTQKLEVNGGVRLNTLTAKPACAVSVRGTLWFTQGASGVADTMEVCAKDANNSYAWRALY